MSDSWRVSSAQLVPAYSGEATSSHLQMTQCDRAPLLWHMLQTASIAEAYTMRAYYSHM